MSLRRRAEALLQAGIDLLTAGRVAESRAALDEARGIFRGLKMSVEAVQCEIVFAQALTADDEARAALDVLGPIRRVIEEGAGPAELAAWHVAMGLALQTCGRLGESLTHHEHARVIFASLGIVAAVADCDARIGAVLAEMGRSREALASLEAARAGHDAEGLTHRAAADDVNRGVILAGLGRSEEARTTFEACRSVFDALDDDVGVADCEINLAIIGLSTGAVQDDLIDRLEFSLGAYERGGLVAQAADCQTTIGQVLSELGRHADALDRFKASRFAHQAAGMVLELARGLVDEASALLAVGHPERALSCLESARPVLEALGGPELATCDMNLGGVLHVLGRYDDASGHLLAARAHYDAAGRVVETADCDITIGNVLRDRGQPERALARYGAARVVLDAPGLEVKRAFCDHNIAVALQMLNRNEEALASSLAAVVAVDNHRYELARSEYREGWSRKYGAVYLTALELANEVPDRALLAELIETARAQSVPDASSDQRGAGALDIWLIGMASKTRGTSNLSAAMAAAHAATGILPLVAPAPVAVGGRSRLGEAANRFDAIDVERAAGLGGEGAWWWGTWVLGGRLWWSVVRPGPAGSEVDAGCVDVRDGSPAGMALGDLDVAFPADGDDREAALRRVRAGPLGTVSVKQSRRLAWALGESLLPPPLRAELLRRMTAGDPPLRLVVAPAPLLARVPFALLALEPGGDDTDPRRLLEAAVLQLSPSVALVDRLIARPPAAKEKPIDIAVIDPLGDLTQTRRVDAAVTSVLAGRAALARQPTDRRYRLATRSNLSEVLRDSAPGSAGVLVFSCHATPAAEGVPATASLVMATAEPVVDDRGNEFGAPLSAWELLNAAPDADHPFPMPQRVGLFACSSAGVDAAGTAEWLGLAPACLWAGARVVISTSWPVLEYEVLDRRMSSVLRYDRDPAASVRDVQKSCLERWRAGDTELMPYLWAAFVVVSVELRGPLS